MSTDAFAAGMQPVPQASDGGGVIHDIGYRRYDGPRLGRPQIVRALTWHSLRAAFGIGRGAKAKIFPVILFTLMCLPALINAVALATNPNGSPAISYDNYIPSLRALVMLIFVAVQAPNMVSGDLRTHSLPLYFARPISRFDYPVAKLVAFVLACMAMLEIPLLILFVGTAAQVHGGKAVWAQTRQLGPGLLYGLAWAVVLASIGLLIASLSGKRVIATIAVAVPLFFTWILAHALMQIGGQVYGPASAGQPPALASLAGLISPFTVLGGLQRWLAPKPRPGVFHPVQAGQLITIGHFGPLYGLMLLILVVAAVAGLLARYRKVGVA